jgi:LacI family transcriptional regulator
LSTSASSGRKAISMRISNRIIRALAERRPVVVIDRQVEGVASIVPEIDPGIDQALAHLRGLGHQSVAFIRGPDNSWMSGARLARLRHLARGRGISVLEIPSGVPTLEGGKAALPKVLAAVATAVLAYSDLMAIGLMRTAIRNEIDVPGELSIVGFDDISGADWTTLPLTTIRTSLAVASDRAVRLLLRETESQSGTLSSSERGWPPITPELVIRGSVGRAPQLPSGNPTHMKHPSEGNRLPGTVTPIAGEGEG